MKYSYLSIILKSKHKLPFSGNTILENFQHVCNVLFCSIEILPDNYKAGYKFSYLNKCVLEEDLNIKLNPNAKLSHH